MRSVVDRNVVMQRIPVCVCMYVYRYVRTYVRVYVFMRPGIERVDTKIPFLSKACTDKQTN